MISQPESNQAITGGAILVEKNTPLPELLRLDSDSMGTGWARLANNVDNQQLEKTISRAGWTFFYMAGTIRTTGFGFERQKMVNAAVKRAIAKVKLQRCNCLEIDDVAMHSFLGVPYVSIAAHSRHIQKGMVFSGRRPFMSLTRGDQPSIQEKEMTGIASLMLTTEAMICSTVEEPEREGRRY